MTGKKAEESALQYIRGAVARGQWSLFCFNQYVPDMVGGSCPAGSGCPCGLICSACPSILTWEASCGRRPNGFYVSDLCPHNTGWCSPQLEKRQRPSPIQVAATLGAVSSGAFGTHQRVTLARVPQLPPQQLPIGRGSL